MEFPRFELTGQVALVTGAARGWAGRSRRRWPMPGPM
jgi:hypothetical protein